MSGKRYYLSPSLHLTSMAGRSGQVRNIFSVLGRGMAGAPLLSGLSPGFVLTLISAQFVVICQFSHRVGSSGSVEHISYNSRS